VAVERKGEREGRRAGKTVGEASACTRAALACTKGRYWAFEADMVVLSWAGHGDRNAPRSLVAAEAPRNFWKFQRRTWRSSEPCFQ
jgi:hypothetical protein